MTDLHKPDRDEPDDLLLSALYREGSDELPPAELDQAIRKQARNVARRRRWFALPKLALAMSLLLGFGVMLRVFDFAPPEQQITEFETPVESSVMPPKAASRSSAPPPVEGMALDSAEMAPVREALEITDANNTRAHLEKKMRERAQRQSTAPGEPVCVGDQPPADAAPIEWLRVIRDLRQSGEQARAQCLQGLYRQRFSEPGQSNGPSSQE